MRDVRYDHVKSIWKSGDLDSFDKIFRIVPKSVVSVDMGLNYERFASKLKKPGLFTFGDIQQMSNLIGVDFKALANLVFLEIKKNSSFKGGE
jgi:hypothetical protein